MMASQKIVSVVVPCFNAAPMLRQALLSIVEQTYPNIEIIFVDNNSSDKSVEIAEQVAGSGQRPFQITRCLAQGVNNARNWGYGLAKGDFVQWMDADDALDPDKIALQVAALEENQAYDIAYGDWTARRIEPGKPRSEQRHNLRQVADQMHRTLAGIWYPNHLYLLRRGAAQQLQDGQAWWPARYCATDVEYSAIAAILGLKFLHVPGAHATYNIWSSKQISGGTPYRDRAAALEAIFLRLRQFATDRTTIKLTQRHQTLLNQNWKIWRMPPNSAMLTKVAGRRFRLRHRQAGKEIELRPREAAVARALISRSVAMTSCHLALLMTETIPEVGDDPALVVEALQRLQADGFLVQIENEPRPNAAPRATGAD